MGIEFEWDPRKATRNKKAHGVSFDDAMLAFADLFSLTVHDPIHSKSEDRFVTMGMTPSGSLLVVSIQIDTRRFEL